MSRLISILLISQIVFAQEKYFVNSLDFGTFTSSAFKVHYTSDSTLIFGGGTHLTTGSLLKSFLAFSDGELNQINRVNYGEAFGEMSLHGLVITPFGYAFSGMMNTAPYGTFPTAIYSYPYLMEVNHAGEVLNLYQLPDPPYQANGRALLYYPETNTYYVGGESTTTTANVWRLALTKITDGELVWRRYYDTYNNRNWITDLLPTADGGCYVVGSVNAILNTNAGDMLFMRIDPEGNIVHHNNYYFEGQQAGCGSFTFTADSCFMLAGFTGKYARLLKVSSTGSILLSRQYFLDYQQSVFNKVHQIGNNYVVAGSVRKAIGGKREAFLMKVRGADGEPLWVRYFDAETNNDYFYDFTPAPDGGFMCVGRTEPVGSANVLAVRTNCMGLLTQPQAGFTVVQDTSAVPDLFTFINQSQYVYPDSIDGGHFTWAFGDGAISHQIHPTHVYPAAGEYLVTLTAVVCQDTSIYQMPVQVRSGSGIAVGFPANLPPSAGTEVVVFPNPATHQVHLRHQLPPNQTAQWTLYDLNGRILHTATLTGNDTHTLSTQMFPNGIYYYTITANGATLQRQKLLILK